MPEGLPDVLLLRVPTDLAFVRPARKMIEGLLLGQGWSEEDVEDAALVYTEILQNAIEHGSRNDGTEQVETRCRLEEAAAWITVTDPGTGKDPGEVLRRDVTRPVPPEEARGRGLYVVHKMSARLERALDPGGGCRIAVRVECKAS